jgi:hypothetical protein
MLQPAFFSLAAAYSPPVSYLPMTMPLVTYDSIANKLAVQTPPAVILGTNVQDNAYPGPGIGSFDPAQPWSVLNGAAFSRRLGWYDPYETTVNSIIPAVQTVYGPGANFWIECTGMSPGLNTFMAVGLWGVNVNSSQTVDYSNPSGVPYSGIFGTNGSSTKWRWDGNMDHNTYTVPFSYLNAPKQPFSANYRLYIGDAAGNDLAPVAATTTTWQWLGPDFVFTSQANVAINTLVESDIFTVPVYSGTDFPWAGPFSVSITGGEYSISTNSGATWNPWLSSAGSLNNSDKVKVRQTSASGPGLTTTTTLAIPGIPGPGTFRVTTTTTNPAWQVRMDVMDQPSLAYAYSVAPNRVEPNNAVIMLKGVILSGTGFLANRDITVTLSGGYNSDYSAQSGTTILNGPFTIQHGKVTVEKLTIR